MFIRYFTDSYFQIKIHKIFFKDFCLKMKNKFKNFILDK